MGHRARLSACLLLAVFLILYWYTRFSSTNTRLVPTLPPISKSFEEGIENVPSNQIASWGEALGTSHSSPNVTLVVPRRKSEDISWLDIELPYLSKAVYVVDDRTAPLRPPANKGNEAMVYLSYIIDFYDQLPEVSIFIHAHRYAWHNGDLLDFDMAQNLRLLDLGYVMQQGYMNLRCQWEPGCPEHLHPVPDQAEDPSKKEEALLATVWNDLYPMQELPSKLGQACCSQFAVTRERIRSVPRAEYLRLRDWLLKTKIRDSLSGRIFEYTWQLLFTGESTWCPNQHTCHCSAYGLCFEDDKAFGRFLDEKLRMKLDEWDYMEQIENKLIVVGDGEEKAWKRRLEVAYWRFDRLRDAAFERGRSMQTPIRIGV